MRGERRNNYIDGDANARVGVEDGGISSGLREWVLWKEGWAMGRSMGRLGDECVYEDVMLVWIAVCLYQ